jgi:hypothetical protein
MVVKNEMVNLRRCLNAVVDHIGCWVTNSRPRGFPTDESFGRPAKQRHKAAHLNMADDAALPQIHCFYEVLSENGDHGTLVAATSSMHAAGHPVRVWTYSPRKLAFLRAQGIDISAADDGVPRLLFEQIIKGSEIRHFSDIFIAPCFMSMAASGWTPM